MKEKDYLKEYIDNHRPELDRDIDTSTLWASIENQLDAPTSTKTKIRSMKWMSIAASVMLLIGAGFLMGRLGSGESVIAQGDVAYADMNHYYTQQINILVREAKNNDQVDATVLDDIATMDEQYQELLKEYKKTKVDGHKEILLTAMINNYRTRIDILNHVLLKIKSAKNGNNIHLQETKI